MLGIDHLLRPLYRRWERQFYESQKGEDWRKDCAFAFMDSDGKKYYRYRDELKVPIVRMRTVQQILREIQNRISDIDIELFLDNVKGELYREAPQQQRLENIGRYIGMLEDRVQQLAPPELLMRLVCAMYIREDQDPGVWSEDIENAKYERLMADSKGALGVFFSQAGLQEYLPHPENIQRSVQEVLEDLQSRAEAFRAANKSENEEPAT